MKFLLCPPTYFRIDSEDNPFMAGQTVDPARALEQWNALKAVYESLGEVILAKPNPEFADQVFTANPILAGPLGSNIVVPAKMRFVPRRPETKMLLAAMPWAEVREANTDAIFEGGGDFLWTPAGELIAAHGPRTDKDAIPAVAACFGVDPLTVHLVTDQFYHLDTCLAVLDDERAMWIPEAFDKPSRAKLQARFQLLDVTVDALNFAGNAHCPDGKHVLIDAACKKTIELLTVQGFNPIPLDTSEFRKSGGSIYCMKHVL